MIGASFPPDRETDREDAQERATFALWVEREISRGNLAPAARAMPRADVVWQWEAYTGRTYRPTL